MTTKLLFQQTYALVSKHKNRRWDWKKLVISFSFPRPWKNFITIQFINIISGKQMSQQLSKNQTRSWILFFEKQNFSSFQFVIFMVHVMYMSTFAHHLSARPRKYLTASRASKSTLKDHIKNCNSCKNQLDNIKQFEIIRKYQTSYEEKNYKALLINRSNSVPHKQQYLNGVSLFLNKFSTIDI